MTFKEMNDDKKKENVFSLLTTGDKVQIITGVVLNIALIILYFVLK